MNSRFHGKRAIAALVTATLLSSGTTVVAPAFAADSPAAETTTAKPKADAPKGEPNGAGNGKFSVETTNVEPGGLVTVKGVGFDKRPDNGGFLALKIDDGKIAPPENQDGADISSVDGDTAYVAEDNLPGEDGNFTAKLRLPNDITEGKHWIRILSGGDGGPTLTKYEWFTVGDEPAEEPTAEDKPGATAAAVEATGDATTAPTGEVSVPVSATGFGATKDLTAKVGDTAAKFRQGRASVDSVKSDDKGAYAGTLVAPAGSALAGSDVTVTVTDGDASAEFTLSPKPSATFTNDKDLPETSKGSTVTAKIGNLPAGTEVSKVGANGENWAAEAVKADESGTATLKVSIPESAEVGTPIEVTAGDKTYPTASKVTPNNATDNVDHFKTTIGYLDAGLYQSAYSAKENALFVTRSVGRPPIKESSLFKLDADTLGIQKEIMPEKDGDNIAHAVYGIDVDDELGYVWVTNTRSNSVAIYSTKDLSLVHQFDKDVANHPRDVKVDPKTHKAYVSIPSGDAFSIEVFDGNTKSKEGTIKLPAGMDNVMSLDLDAATGDLYAVSRSSGKAVKVETRNGNAITEYQLPEKDIPSAAGVAFDTKNHNLWVTSQDSSKVAVYNVDQKKTVAVKDTGAGALNAAYDPVNNLVYVINRGGGTVSVFNADTQERVANLDVVGSNANHVAADGRGNVYAVNKFNEEKDGKQVNRVVKITPAEQDSTDEAKAVR